MTGFGCGSPLQHGPGGLDLVVAQVVRAEADAVVVDDVEKGPKAPGAVDRNSGLDRDEGADEPPELLRGPQSALDTGARHLEVVATAGHQVVVFVQGGGNGGADLAEDVQVDALRAVDQDADQAGGALDVPDGATGGG